ncbi:MAG: adenylosuccinate lyase [Bacillota bacterium]|nr:adenylosuccinate lyase [Bacillota bacterium]
MSDRYQSPFGSRYGSREMQQIFSPRNRFTTWRRLWLALAEAQAELGLEISEAQLDELHAHVDDLNLEVAEAYERELRHDVMAHIRAWADQCPLAGPILHLGATSCYVGDNTELILMRDALDLLGAKLLRIIGVLADFAETYSDLACLGYTHFQAAQPTTVGKRATLWLQDFILDYEELRRFRDWLPLLGSKGTTGTQASFLELFDGDAERVLELDRQIARRMGFPRVIDVSGQTYTRKIDSRLLDLLSGIAQSAAKFSNDIRLLQHLHEVEEPFGRQQVGSSAMAYKRNPMRSERIAGIARYVMSLPQNAALTVAGQWFERTLDDSSNRRVTIPEGCLATDAVLDLVINVAGGLVVHEQVIRRNLDAELPFMATEALLMDGVRAGGDRQLLHERIRVHSMAAAGRVRTGDGTNDLLERLEADPDFPMTATGLAAALDPQRFVGLAPQQTRDYLARVVRPLLDAAGPADIGSSDITI